VQQFGAGCGTEGGEPFTKQLLKVLKVRPVTRHGWMLDAAGDAGRRGRSFAICPRFAPRPGTCDSRALAPRPFYLRFHGWGGLDLNQRPTDYESAALTN
jgi:hypothetical protein